MSFVGGRKNGAGSGMCVVIREEMCSYLRMVRFNPPNKFAIRVSLLIP